MFTLPFFLTSFAILTAALPANITERDALEMIERATLAPVYSKCTVPNTVALTFGKPVTLRRPNQPTLTGCLHFRRRSLRTVSFSN